MVLISLTFGLIAFSGGTDLFTRNFTVQAVGDLTITWGVPEGDPIFVVSNMVPGQTETRTVGVSNGASASRPVGIKGIRTAGLGNIEDKLNIVIKEGLATLYGPTTLTQFFTDSSSTDSVPLSTLGPGGSTNYDIQVTFDPTAGNEYQSTSVVFDLKIGISIATPEACQNIVFSGLPIFGTSGNNIIHGTNGNDLIFALEGNDKVFGKLGDDCIVGAEGNDELRGEVGQDILIGGSGNDLLIGGNNEDTIFGENGNDEIRGENSEDVLSGGAGDDKIIGGNADDQIDGGEGNDNIKSENGADTVLGQAGNDKIDGGSGNDNLTGGAGTDSIDGKSGRDTCDGEIEIHCEI